ncbi:MAG: hypothetical protein QM530_00425 [Phycisphaerales bacterium]|nr:hypothetical protein [Phycisphaerales bacterium]
MNKRLGIIVFFFFLASAYYVSSIMLLDGKFTYKTSFNASTILESKEKNIFVTKDLVVIPSGEAFENWENDLEIWTNRNPFVYYYGFLFHYTRYYDGCRHLNIVLKPKRTNSIFQDLCFYWDSRKDEIMKLSNEYDGKVGDTVKMVFLDCQNDNVIGSLSIVIR